MHRFYLSLPIAAAGMAIRTLVALTLTVLVILTLPALPDSATRLTTRDRDLHIRALELSDRDRDVVVSTFNEYLAGTEETERAVADYASWSGRWAKEHLYWMQMPEWANRIAPPSSIQSAVDEAYLRLRAQYFAQLRDDLPARANRIALLGRIAARNKWLSSIMFQGQYPDLAELVAMKVPHTLDRETVQASIAQYEQQLAPILERRMRLEERRRPDFEKAMEKRDIDALARQNAAIPLNDCEIRQMTYRMIDVFAAALDEAEAQVFREAAESACYPEPQLMTPIGTLIERALRDPDLTTEMKDRVRGIQRELNADRERLRGELHAAFDAMFDPAAIERVARENAEFSLGLRSEMPSSVDEKYKVIVKGMTERANRLAIELQEMIQDK